MGSSAIAWRNEKFLPPEIDGRISVMMFLMASFDHHFMIVKHIVKNYVIQVRELMYPLCSFNKEN